MHRGFAKIYRKFLEWEWYDDIPTKILYLHCLLKANHKDKPYRGKTVSRGSFLTGREELAKQTGLSVQQVRTSVNKLKSTNHLTIKPTKQGTVVYIVDFDTYNGGDDDSNQHTNQQRNQPVTNNQPDSNQQSTTTKNDKNLKKGKNDKNSMAFNSFADIDPETSTDAERDFELFYAAYPNPQKKPLARTAFMSALGAMPSVHEMIAIIDERIELGQWSRNELQWIPAPARYLSEEGYNDPVVPRVKKEKEETPAEQVKRRLAEIERGENEVRS